MKTKDSSGCVTEFPPCRGLWGRLFGHKIEPRYSTTSAVAPNAAAHVANTWVLPVRNYVSQFETATEAFNESIRALSSKKITYEMDICVRCGLVAPRPDRSVISPQNVRIDPAAKDVAVKLSESGISVISTQPVPGSAKVAKNAEPTWVKGPGIPVG